jgi:hypothetical protein
MQVFKIAFIAFLLIFSSCKKEVEQTIVYSNVIYELDDVKIYSSNAEKTKQKSPELLLSIMYSDIFNQGIPTNKLLEIAELSASNGDKTMFTEMVFSQFLTEPTASVPTDTQMRANLAVFIEDNYIRFFQRKPTAYEKIYLESLISSNSTITVENVFTSFALSNEYYFY